MYKSDINSDTVMNKFKDPLSNDYKNQWEEGLKKVNIIKNTLSLLRQNIINNFITFKMPLP